MSRQSTGQVLERTGKRGRTFALRFRACGARQYVTLGSAEDGWNRQRAEDELKNVLADVRRGIWRPPETKHAIEQPKEEPTFHVFASEWLAAREAEGLAAKSIADLHWSLSNHLLPYFAYMKLSEIDVQAVDRYKVAKVKERQGIEARRPEREAAMKPLVEERRKARNRGDDAQARDLSRQIEALRATGLSANSVNHTLSDLAQVLETAVEYGLIPSNPASGKRRRLKSTRPNRPWVEPEQLGALLDAAKGDDGLGVGRVLLAVLAGAGLRIGEALALRWQHVDLAIGTLHVVSGKTAAAARSIDLPHSLREELVLWRAESRFTKPDDLVLCSPTGRKNNPSNLRRDVLGPAIVTANERLAKDGIAPIAAIGFHGLRRAYASLRCACGDDIRYTASQLGHEDPRFTLKAYAQATKRRERLSGPHLKAYDRAIEWARMGTSSDLEHVPAMTEEKKNPAGAGLS
jgi:integrase